MDPFCTVGANDSYIDLLIDSFRLRRMLYMIRDSCLTGQSVKQFICRL